MTTKDKADRAKSHSFENTPPQQERYSRGDDDWNLMTNACPIASPKVSSEPGDAGVIARENADASRPFYDSDRSRFCHDSMTDGKGRK